MTFKALLASAAYDYGTSTPGKHIPKGVVLDTELSTREMSVFKSPRGRVYVAYRGTDPWHNPSDLIADLGILNGQEASTQRFIITANNTQRVIDKYGKDYMELIGHSLGGSQALFNNSRAGIKATVFNPGFSPLDLQNTWVPGMAWMGLGKFGTEGAVTVYRTKRDIVSGSITADRVDNFTHKEIDVSGIAPHGAFNFVKWDNDIQRFLDEDPRGVEAHLGNTPTEPSGFSGPSVIAATDGAPGTASY